MIRLAPKKDVPEKQVEILAVDAGRLTQNVFPAIFPAVMYGMERNGAESKKRQKGRKP